MDFILKRVVFALKKYKMVENGDTLAVAVSGGKDSLVLLLALSKIQKYYNIKFNIKAVTLDMCFQNKPTNFSLIEKFCKNLGVQYLVKRTNLWDIIFVQRKEKNPCSLCSKIRKGVLNELALGFGCNKIALGHHKDDAVETLLMNIVYNRKLKCFSPVTYLSRKNITILRPLVFCEESQIMKIANKLSLPIQKNECTEDKNTQRQKIKDVLSLMEKNIFKNFKESFFKSFIETGLSNW